jgi:hypothetical protein
MSPDSSAARSQLADLYNSANELLTQLIQATDPASSSSASSPSSSSSSSSTHRANKDGTSSTSSTGTKSTSSSSGSSTSSGSGSKNGGEERRRGEEEEKKVGGGVCGGDLGSLLNLPPLSAETKSAAVAAAGSLLKTVGEVLVPTTNTDGVATPQTATAAASQSSSSGVGGVDNSGGFSGGGGVDRSDVVGRRLVDLRESLKLAEQIPSVLNAIAQVHVGS